ncbi:MAG: NAD-dependent epimerase/dehydratase family protein, partial [Actinomycetota bacterium]|nr:NAD-dependent epimerase/dehydratase family protein [Actinomycetota bacterium]
HVADSHTLIRRVVHAAEIDTVVDTRLVLDPIVTSARRAHENNVMGTLNVLAACGDEDTPVKKLVFRSGADYYGAEQDDPAFFTEAMTRPHPPRTALERDIVEAEKAVAEFAAKQPRVDTIVLRFANAIGPDVRSSLASLLDLPVVPGILGFEPRLQVIHQDDVVSVLDHAVRGDVPGGIYNAAGDGVLVLSEIAGLLGKPLAPVIPPWGTGLAASVLSRTGLKLNSLLLGLLRFGRGVDNRRLKATGYRYTYTSREAIIKVAEHQRLRAVLSGPSEGYRYEQAVEEFLRRSPSVRATARAPEEAPANLAPGQRRGGDDGEPPSGYDDLTAEEVVRLLPSLEPGGREAIAAYERAHARRKTVLGAAERLRRAETPA